jgi:hypothetical protein
MTDLDLRDLAPIAVAQHAMECPRCYYGSTKPCAIADALPRLIEVLTEHNSRSADPGRLWRVIDPDGETWAETSSERDARSRMRPGDALVRQYVYEARTEWRDVP